MYDNYTHLEHSVIYIDENIPGPKENSTEYEIISENFNSQLAHYCTCNGECLEDSCQCLQMSGGANYILHDQNSTEQKICILNVKKNVNNYPVIECSDLCKCFKYCGNRLVQNGPLKNLLPKSCKNRAKGLGLFTNSNISKGIFICEYAGEVITKSQALSRHDFNQLHGKMNYIYCLREHVDEKSFLTFVDPSKFGNIGRYVNHSCEPNCEIIPVRVNNPIPKLAIFSSTAISSGTEITIDYGANTNNSISKNVGVRKKCLCGSTNCKEFMPYDCY